MKHKHNIDDKELAQLREADFDGHTDFQTMTFEQKLTWLSEAVVSVYRLAKGNPEAPCNALFNRNS